MNDWGWNPSTIQAAGAIATVGAFIYLIRSFYNSRKQMTLKTRPWLFLENTIPYGESAFGLVVKNIGELPGLKVTLDTSSLDEAIFKVVVNIKTVCIGSIICVGKNID